MPGRNRNRCMNGSALICLIQAERTHDAQRSGCARAASAARRDADAIFARPCVVAFAREFSHYTENVATNRYRAPRGLESDPRRRPRQCLTVWKS